MTAPSPPPASGAPSAIAGVYKGVQTAIIGTGATRRRVSQEGYFFAEQTSPEEVSIQPLNVSYIPSGPLTLIALEDFLGRFTPEPDVFKYKTLPAIAAMKKTLAKAERLRSQGQNYTAEFEFKNALKLDDSNVRANYGLGLTYLDRGDTEQADTVLRRLVTLEEAYTRENKHLFNEFGIKLRKNGMYDQALAYYGRALKLSQRDEHLLYNIARLLHEKKEYAQALRFCDQALALDPDLTPAQKLAAVLRKLTANLPPDPDDLMTLDDDPIEDDDAPPA